MPTGLGRGQARRRYAAVAVAIGLGLFAGGVALAVPHGSEPGRRARVAACGLVACGANLPDGNASSAVGGVPGGQRSTPGASPSADSSPHPSPTGARPTPPSTPAPSPTRSGSPPPGAGVTVTYRPDQGDHRGHRVRGTLTLVNHTSRSFSGWTVTLTFPGDKIDWVGAAGADMLPFATWHVSGDTLTLSAALAAETLGPRATETISISGHGATNSPSGCAFDGSACQR